MKLKPVVELGVEEAYLLLSTHFQQSDLPPLDAIENEDWGRDMLLTRFGEIADADLARVGLVFERESLSS